jgi:conjugative transfer signal peptidase TraF
MTRRATWAIVACAVAGLMLLPAIVASPPVLAWNASASVPIGLYAVRPAGALRVGQLVFAMPPGPLAAFLAYRDYLPERVPLLKHVAALPSQQVCRTGTTITIDGIFAAIALTRDSRDRSLPAWSGCRTISQNEVFLLNSDVRDSLDGRYFGPLPISSIIGSAVPIWTERDQTRAVRRARGEAPTVSSSPARRT